MRKVLVGAAAVGMLTMALPATAAAPNYPELLGQAGIEYEELASGGFRVLYEFDDGRSQLVFLQPQGQFEGLDVVEIYSPVMRLAGDTVPAALGKRLLEMNGLRKLTYFGIEQVDDALMVFCYHNTPADRLDAKTLQTLLLTVSAFADEMEKEQLGVASDEF